MRYLSVVFTIVVSTSASKDILSLPLTINPLLQDAIERNGSIDDIAKMDPEFYNCISYSDMIKKLKYPSRNHISKTIYGLMILGLAAKLNGLTNDNLECKTPSRWTIQLKVEDLVSASVNLTLPLNAETRLVNIQEAMFNILEKRFNFNINDVAKQLKTSTLNIYGFLENGWITVVNAITKINVRLLSSNYKVEPMVIARALNLSLVELYNSTLLQLEDILINKTDKIREAAEKSRRTMSSSILELTTMTSRLNDERKSTIITRKTTRVAIVKESITPLSTTIKVSFTKDHKLNSTVYSNGQSSSTMASSIVRSSYQTGVDLHKTNTIKYTIGKILSFVESVSISSAIAQSMFIEPSKKSIEKRLSTMSLTHSSGRTSSNDQNIQQSGSMLFLLSKSSPYIVVPAPYSKGIGNIKPRVTSLLPSIVSSISKDRENVPNSNTKEDDDSKLLMIFIPIIIVLLILIVVALFKSMKHKRQVKSIHIMSNKRYGLKSKNVSISPPISLANNESEVRAARSMLRISGVGNFETINEGDEPAKPEESDKSEVFDL